MNTSVQTREDLQQEIMRKKKREDQLECFNVNLFYTTLIEFPSITLN